MLGVGVPFSVSDIVTDPLEDIVGVLVPVVDSDRDIVITTEAELDSVRNKSSLSDGNCVAELVVVSDAV